MGEKNEENVGDLIQAIAFRCLPTRVAEGKHPSKRYLNLIIEGAKQRKLDPEYIEFLESHKPYDVSINSEFQFFFFFEYLMSFLYIYI